MGYHTSDRQIDFFSQYLYNIRFLRSRSLFVSAIPLGVTSGRDALVYSESAMTHDQHNAMRGLTSYISYIFLCHSTCKSSVSLFFITYIPERICTFFTPSLSSLLSLLSVSCSVFLYTIVLLLSLLAIIPSSNISFCTAFKNQRSFFTLQTCNLPIPSSLHLRIILFLLPFSSSSSPFAPNIYQNRAKLAISNYYFTTSLLFLIVSVCFF
jgi:hypothetical protein